jgi:hypothetical protein
MGARRGSEDVVQPAEHITADELEILSPLIGALARMAAKQLAREDAEARAGARPQHGSPTLREAPEG